MMPVSAVAREARRFDAEHRADISSAHSDEALESRTHNLLEWKTWEPRVAAVLLFHPNPSAAMPRKCAVKISRYETKEDEPERDHLGRQETVEGPLYRVIHDATSKIKEIMTSVTIWTASGLKNAEYPPESIWEVLVNALIHRDYSISDDTHVLIFD